MNAPLGIESLLWMASPMAAWAQASAEPPPVASPLPASEPATVELLPEVGSGKTAA